MADGMYIGMAGAAARAAQLEAISDNLANTQTPGFKKAEPAFEAFLADSKAKDQAFPVAVSTAFDLSEGASLHTGERLDVVPNDGAFLAVQNGDSVAFTRAGHLTLDPNGFLTAGHNPVLDVNGQPLRVPENVRAQPTQTEIHSDGTLWFANERIGQLATFKLSGPLERIGPTLMRPQPNGQAAAVQSGVRVGELELGNVSPLTCAVQMVSVQRHFEAAMQSIQTYRQLDQRAADVGRVR